MRFRKRKAQPNPNIEALVTALQANVDAVLHGDEEVASAAHDRIMIHVTSDLLFGAAVMFFASIAAESMRDQAMAQFGWRGRAYGFTFDVVGEASPAKRAAIQTVIAQANGDTQTVYALIRAQEQGIDDDPAAVQRHLAEYLAEITRLARDRHHAVCPHPGRRA